PGAAAIAVADMRERLAAAGGTLIDAQWDSPFLRSLGAAPIGRERYLALLGDRPEEPIPLPAASPPPRRLLPPAPGVNPLTGPAGAVRAAAAIPFTVTVVRGAEPMPTALGASGVPYFSQWESAELAERFVDGSLDLADDPRWAASGARTP